MRTLTSRDRVLPCPFCGKYPLLIVASGDLPRELYQLSCFNRKCISKLSTKMYVVLARLISSWNTSISSNRRTDIYGSTLYAGDREIPKMYYV